MKRRLPLMIVLVLGIFGALAFMIPHPAIRNIDETMRNDVIRIIAAFSLVLGVGSIIRHHVMKIRRKAEYWPYSWITLVALVVTAVIGLFGGIDPEARGLIPTSVAGVNFHIQTLYMNIIVPLAATMFALLAFFMASAAYRAFRARNVEATLLLLAAFLMMLGAVPFGANLPFRTPALVLLTLALVAGIYLSVRDRKWGNIVVFVALWLVLGLAILFLFGPTVGTAAEDILTGPNTAAKRGILFGVGLGMIATSLKIILGIERGWLGGGSE